MTIDQINQQLLAVASQREEKLRLSRRLQSSRAELSDEQRRGQQLRQVMLAEERDVKALEGVSLTSLFRSVLGDKEQQLEQERQEYLRAKLQFDQASYAVQRLREEVAQLAAAVATLPDLEKTYQSLLSQKAETMRQADGYAQSQAFALGERLTGLRSRQKELQEAIAAGQAAANELDSVAKALDSAAGWGVWDMLGGGLIATMAKHSQMDQAKDLAGRAQQALSRFARELKDVEVQLDLRLEIGDFLRFADYFFDGLIVDWTVQARINDSLAAVRRQQEQVQRMLGALAPQLVQVQRELEQVNADYELALQQA